MEDSAWQNLQQYLRNQQRLRSACTPALYSKSSRLSLFV